MNHRSNFKKLKLRGFWKKKFQELIFTPWSHSLLYPDSTLGTLASGKLSTIFSSVVFSITPPLLSGPVILDFIFISQFLERLVRVFFNLFSSNCRISCLVDACESFEIPVKVQHQCEASILIENLLKGQTRISNDSDHFWWYVVRLPILSLILSKASLYRCNFLDG